MGGAFALIGGFVGLVGLAAMIANIPRHGADPIGILLFSILLVNGLVAVYRRATGRDETSRKRGPLSGKQRKRKG